MAVGSGKYGLFSWYVWSQAKFSGGVQDFFSGGQCVCVSVKDVCWIWIIHLIQNRTLHYHAVSEEEC